MSYACDPTALAQLHDMGFDHDAALAALTHVGGRDVHAAVSLLSAQPHDSVRSNPVHADPYAQSGYGQTPQYASSGYGQAPDPNYTRAVVENDILLSLLDQITSGETEVPEQKPVKGFKGTVAFAGQRPGITYMQEWMDGAYDEQKMNIARLRYSMNDVVDTLMEGLADQLHTSRLMNEAEALGKRTGYAVMGKLGGGLHSLNPFAAKDEKQVKAMEVPEVKLSRCGFNGKVPFGTDAVRRQLFVMLGRGFLNGAGGGCVPEPVIHGRVAWSRVSQVDPVMWRFKTLPIRVREAEQYVADHLQVDPNDLKFTLNVEQGLCSILRSLPWQAGEAVLFINDMGEPARAAAQFLTTQYGVEVLEVTPQTYPYTADTLKAQIKSTPHIYDAMKKPGKTGRCRIRLAIVAEVGYKSGVKVSVKAMSQWFHKHGVSVVADGTHAVGNHDVVVAAKGADWYIASLGSWMYTEPGVAVIVTHPLKQIVTQTLTVSYFDRGNAGKKSYVTTYQKEFSYQGLQDFANWCSTFQAMQMVDSMCGGFAGIRSYNTKLAKDVSATLAKMWRTNPLQAKDNKGSMVVFPLPGASGPQYTADVAANLTAYLATTPVQDNVNFDGYPCPYVVHISSIPVNGVPTLCARFTCQIWNVLPEYEGAARFILSLQPYTNCRPAGHLRVDMYNTLH